MPAAAIDLMLKAGRHRSTRRNNNSQAESSNQNLVSSNHPSKQIFAKVSSVGGHQQQQQQLQYQDQGQSLHQVQTAASSLSSIDWSTTARFCSNLAANSISRSDQLVASAGIPASADQATRIQLASIWNGTQVEEKQQATCWPYTSSLQYQQPADLPASNAHQQFQDYSRQFASLHRLSAVASVLQKNLGLTSACSSGATAAPIGSPSHFSSNHFTGSVPSLRDSSMANNLIESFKHTSEPATVTGEIESSSRGKRGRSNQLLVEVSRKGPGRRGPQRKCRKMYGVEQRSLWCTQCKWKKACSRFCDSQLSSNQLARQNVTTNPGAGVTITGTSYNGKRHT